MDALLPVLRQFWLVWLVALFVGVVVWAMWPGNRKRFERDAEIPFREDSKDADQG